MIFYFFLCFWGLQNRVLFKTVYSWFKWKNAQNSRKGFQKNRCFLYFFHFQVVFGSPKTARIFSKFSKKPTEGLMRKNTLFLRVYKRIIIAIKTLKIIKNYRFCLIFMLFLPENRHIIEKSSKCDFSTFRDFFCAFLSVFQHF